MSTILKIIKKVKITNIPKTEGSIVDSMEANVDKTSNAPSIKAVLEKIQSVANSIKHAVTADKLKNARNIKLSGVVQGNASFDGSKDITIDVAQENIAVISGEQQLSASSDTSGDTYAQTKWEKNYPTGFNGENSIALCFGAKFAGEGFSYGDVNIAKASIGSINGAVPRNVTLNGDNISIQAWNNTPTAKKLTYKIVLMKVEDEND